MFKIMHIVGARPQFIKMDLISRALRSRGAREVIIHTGQHYDPCMSDLFFKELGIPHSDFNLGVGARYGSGQVPEMMLRIDKIIKAEKPGLVLVYGDTNSTLAGALAAVFYNLPVAHVEAGLRSYRLSMPEERNRIVTDSITSIFFCPTKTAVSNLKKEGKVSGVYLVGDVMYDSLKRFIRKIKMSNEYGEYILCTIHRAENTDNSQNLCNIFKALGLTGKKIILPLHPRTEKFLKKYKISIAKNIKMIKPVSYSEMLALERNARLVVTDSGGVQKEAFILNVPAVTIRSETEWAETVEAGLNFISGVSVAGIRSAVNKALCVRKSINPEKYYGDGFAHRRIAEIVIRRLKGYR